MYRTIHHQFRRLLWPEQIKHAKYYNNNIFVFNFKIKNNIAGNKSKQYNIFIGSLIVLCFLHVS